MLTPSWVLSPGSSVMSGSVCPFSHLLTAWGLIRSLPASFSCVMFFFSRSARICFPMSFIAFSLLCHGHCKRIPRRAQ